MEAFHERLQKIMEEKEISQSELCTQTGIKKSTLSQYLSGKFKPKQVRTDKLAEVLKVSPAWLMGYDVQREEFGEAVQLVSLSRREYEIIKAYRNNPDLHADIETLIYMYENPEQGKKKVLRIAYSLGGKIAPSHEKRSQEQMQKLENAPETDDDL